MEKMEFFDANCQLGMPMNGALAFAEDVDALYEQLNYAGVQSALVRHVNLDHCSAVYCNERLAASLKQDREKRLFGCWCLLPEQCQELPPDDIFFREMKENRIRALTLLPDSHRWIPSRKTIGRKMDQARERKIPILISCKHFGWQGIHSFLEEFPDNRYVCCQTGLWGADRNLRPLLEQYANFHVELSEYWVPEGIEDLVKLYGAERVLYGSGYPDYHHANLMGPIRFAQLPMEARKAIASGNLKQLINEVE